MPYEPDPSKHCPLCKQPAQVNTLAPNAMPTVGCMYCGTFKMHAEHPQWFQPMPHPVLSGVARSASVRLSMVQITSETEPGLLSTAPKSPGEKLVRFLDNLAWKTDRFMGQDISISTLDYPLAFGVNPKELAFIVKSLQASSKLDDVLFTTDGQIEFKLSMQAWEDLHALESTNPESLRAFVAMWFNPKMDGALKTGFHPAIKEAGYECIRIDKVHFNNKIDDAIIAEIRRSRLVVADFTGNRGGVYYEAGFAQGLGLPVIYTCCSKWEKRLHFDTRQYNHILWETPEGLKDALRDRILATLGQGPLKASTT